MDRVTSSQIPEWVASLADDVWRWFQTVRIPGHPGWVRYCTEGSLFEPGERAGLGLSCLALKLLHMLGMLSRLDTAERGRWLAHIQSFQTASGRAAGYFEDEAVLRVVDRWWRKDWGVRRAETRQACAALLSAGSQPLTPLPVLASTPRQVRRFVRRLDWRNPWAAGSHAGHLMFFLHANATSFGSAAARDSLLPALLEELDSLQDAETGCWGVGNPSPARLINGAMKVITGYDFAGIPFSHPERLIDFALSLANERDACHHADIVYVLHQCSRASPHRQSEVRAFAVSRLEQLVPFRKEDGGFSFNKEGTGRTYYGLPIGQGRPVSDIHGTTLFVWTVVMLADLLEWRDRLAWRLPVT